MENKSIPFTDELEGYLSQTIQRAIIQDEALARARQRTSELKTKSELVRRVIENNAPVALDLEECKKLIAYLMADNELIWNEHCICYLKGLTDGIEIRKTVG